MTGRKRGGRKGREKEEGTYLDPCVSVPQCNDSTKVRQVIELDRSYQTQSLTPSYSSKTLTLRKKFDDLL